MFFAVAMDEVLSSKLAIVGCKSWRSAAGFTLCRLGMLVSFVGIIAALGGRGHSHDH